jgi:hypothetical protein
MQYNFNLETIIEQIVPPVLRKPKMLAWLKALNNPIVAIYNALMVDYYLNRGELNKTGQMIVLKAALIHYSNANAGFKPNILGELPPPTKPKPHLLIYVEEYPFNVELIETVKLSEKFIAADIVPLGQLSEGITMQAALISELESPYDFQVRIHTSLVNDLSLRTVRAVVDKYKVLGRTYKVVTF